MARARIRVRGDKALIKALNEMVDNMEDKELVTKPLAEKMKAVVHVVSGYLKSTIYARKEVAEATAPYAGFEEERGGEHAYATKAIKAFKLEKFADHVVKPF